MAGSLYGSGYFTTFVFPARVRTAWTGNLACYVRKHPVSGRKKEGGRKEADLGYAWLKLESREAMTHFVFADEDIQPLLGRVAINSLLLEYDADRQVLLPMTNLTL